MIERVLYLVIAGALGLASKAPLLASTEDGLVRPLVREANLPRTRWEYQQGSDIWTRGALAALRTHGAALAQSEPVDIEDWCPAYPEADLAQRQAFWVGFLSALAKHESTYRPYAVGGGGRWFGLLQIQPSTARGYGCAARSGQDLKDGASNVSCAVRIMAVTVPRDGVVASKGGRWGGVAADWGPMRNANKRADMQAWLGKQTYCRPLQSVRPRERTGTGGDR